MEYSGQRNRRRSLTDLTGTVLDPSGSSVENTVCAWSLRRDVINTVARDSAQIDWITLFDDLMGEGLISVSTLVEIPRGRYIEELGEMIDSDSKR